MTIKELRRLHLAAKDRPTYYDCAVLQTGMQGDPWRVGIASILLHQTTRRQAQLGLRRLLERWSTPALLAKAEDWEVAIAVRACGLQTRRARYLIGFSYELLYRAHGEARQLPGVGPYVLDALKLFCFGRVDVESTDRVMRMYAEVVT